jgi:hypothetical protein
MCDVYKPPDGVLAAPLLFFTRVMDMRVQRQICATWCSHRTETSHLTVTSALSILRALTERC